MGPGAGPSRRAVPGQAGSGQGWHVSACLLTYDTGVLSSVSGDGLCTSGQAGGTEEGLLND